MRRRHVTDTLFVLALLGAFAMTGLTAAVMGANAYDGIARGMERNDALRASLSYLTQKIRHSDTAGGVCIRAWEGGDALVLTQTVEGAAYETWIYAWQGRLMETTVAAGETPAPGSGQTILEIAQLSLQAEQGGLIRITAADAWGNGAQTAAWVRCGVG